ncbi:MAG: LPS export ABC transporter ATP-binding protein [Campylobacterales bacterium]
MSGHLLRAEHLSKTIKKHTIINDVSIELRSGEVVGLLGPNGAGKTTTFYMICGLIEVGGGRVLLDEREVTRLSLSERSLQGIGYLPQEASIFKDLTVEENLMMAAELAGLKDDESQQRIEELLDAFDIEPIRYRKGVALSGGERRRVEIARALVSRPRFLLLDEPFAGIDPIAVLDIQAIIEELKNEGIGILITDHNFRETLAICDRVYVLKEGRVLTEGTPAEITADAAVQKHYLGGATLS